MRLWDPESRTISAQAPLAGPWSLLFCSGDGERLLTIAPEAKAGSRVKFWRLPSLEPIPVEPIIEPSLGDGVIRAFTITGDFTRAAILADGQGRTFSLRVIDCSTGQTCWSNGVDFASSMEFSPDGRFLFLQGHVGEVTSKVRIWESLSGHEIGLGLTDHREWISALVFWPDGKTMASASADRTIRLWDLRGPGRPQALGSPLKGHRSEVWGLALLPDQRTLVSVGKDGTFLTWDSQKARADETHLTIKTTNWCTWRFAADSKSILTIEENGQVTRWRGLSFERGDVLLHLTNVLGKVVVSRDSRWLATGSTNGLVDLWDLSKRAPVKEFAADMGPAFPEAFREGGRRLITLSGKGVVKEWDLNTLHEIAAWTDLEGGRILSQDERWYYAANCAAGKFLARDLVTGNQTVQINQGIEVENCTGMDVSADGKLLAMSSETGFVRLFDRESMRVVENLRGFLLEAVFDVCFSPDGKRLATVSGGRDPIKLWDVNRRRELLRLEPAGQGLFAYVQFSPDGNIVGALRTDKTLHLWRAPSWEEIGAVERVP